MYCCRMPLGIQIDLYCQQLSCSVETLVSGNIVYADIHRDSLEMRHQMTVGHTSARAAGACILA